MVSRRRIASLRRARTSTLARGLPALVALGALAASGCTGDLPLLGSSEEPVAIVALSRGPTPSEVVLDSIPVDSTLHALVATLGSPRGGRLREITRFSMRRRADGAEFDWRITPGGAAIDFAFGWQFPRAEWNAHLAWRGTDGRLGREDLAAGDTYDLEIESEGRLMTGSVTMPAAPAPRAAADGAVRVISWDPVPGASLYTLEASDRVGFTWRLTEPSFTFTIDPDIAPAPTLIRVTAVEENLASYGVGNATSAGITGAFGVFGAAATDSVVIPPLESAARLQAASMSSQRGRAASNAAARSRADTSAPVRSAAPSVEPLPEP